MAGWIVVARSKGAAGRPNPNMYTVNGCASNASGDSAPQGLHSPTDALGSPTDALELHPSNENQELEREFSGASAPVPYVQILKILNDRCQSAFRSETASTRAFIRARWREGWRLQDFDLVIAHKSREWIGDPNMAQYLRPQTLFGTKFERYLESARTATVSATAENFDDYLARLRQEAKNGTD